ncbi:MAG: DUF3899 domain-containing protein [Butyrivibrio sp.]|nr:DUF3899 domain-containing protein [Butyrivibrio sp.]
MKKRSIRNLLITVGVDLAAAGLVVWYESTYFDLAAQYIRILSDAFFVAGMLTLCIGLILLAANAGGLYAAGYLWKKLAQKLSRGKKEIPDYYDYVREKRAKKKPSLSHFFISSGIFITVGAVLAVIHG